MANKTVKMTSPTGATVTVDAEKVDGLLGRGFTKEAAKKADSHSKSSKK